MNHEEGALDERFSKAARILEEAGDDIVILVGSGADTTYRYLYGNINACLGMTLQMTRDIMSDDI